MAKKRTTKKRRPGMSIAQLEKALANTKQKLQGLKEKREKLLAQIAEVDKQIAELAGEPVAPVAEPEAPATAPAPVKPKKPRKLPRNTMSLSDAIVKALSESKDPMRAGEIAQAVKAAGYKSKSKTFVKQVSGAAADDKRVEKAARGLFALKKKAKK